MTPLSPETGIMFKLSDTQSILLSTASQRENGSLLPLSGDIRPGGGAGKALAALVGRGLAAERETSDPGAVHRTDGDLRFGLFVTAAGLTAIGVEPENVPNAAVATDAPGTLDGPDASDAAPRAGSAGRAGGSVKTAAVLALLGRPEGATVADLIAATGWLPHTTRAALTGLRRKGHAIARGKTDGVTCYRIVDAG